jgi:hypothetical protein
MPWLVSSLLPNLLTAIDDCTCRRLHALTATSFSLAISHGAALLAL